MAGNFILVGLMGSGKTTVGRLLARRLGKRFLDSDHEIEAMTGVKIPTIFEIEGEAGFRVREHEILTSVSAQHDFVLATGGGIVLREDNRALLRGMGTVIYLRASVDELWQRTRHDRQRPLLQTADPRAKLAELLKIREPMYQDVAHVVIDTSRQNVHTLVDHLIHVLWNHSKYQAK